MSRLVVVDFALGRRVDVRGQKYRVAALVRHAGRLKLKSEDQSHPQLVLTFDQLATLLVQGDAELVDDLDALAPDKQHPERQINNIAQLDLHRLVDWLVKVFLLRYMSAYLGSGPNTQRFRAAFSEACQLLTNWFDAVGLVDVPLQTAWTTYQDLLRWRRARYSLSALVVKGLEYRPWTKRGAHFGLASAIAREVVDSNPGFSAARVHEAVNERLRK